jgi:hypothetical protein
MEIENIQQGQNREYKTVIPNLGNVQIQELYTI